MASSSSVPTISPKCWIGKRSAYKLWQHVNLYVQDYTSEHQDQMHSPWFHTWFNFYNVIKIGEETRDFQMTAYLITTNPDATVLDCFETISDLIPNIRSYITVTSKSPTGNICCTIHSQIAQ